MYEQLTNLTPLVISVLIAIWCAPGIRDRLFATIPRLPKWAQPIAPITLAIVAAVVEGYQTGLRGDELFAHGAAQGGEFGVLAIGIWHLAKRWLPVVKKAAAPTAIALLVGITSMSSTGCSVLRSPTFWDGVEKACVIAMTARQEVQVEATRRGIAFGELAGALCKISDIIEPFVVEEETGAMKVSNVTPADEAVTRAKQKGLIK
jgi:hypothetical protein